ncbi:MAG TPA: DUF4097 family beta strand repeat-containing protein [Gemmatimonadaceae bacterium]|nr:DUF4097 family beta strand repeat-containing protein [Gemmatimonadaceae bacterium]
MMHSRFPHRSRVAIAAVAAAVSPIVACAQQTDTTIAVQPNARVQIQNFAGSIRVVAWDRNAVRVHAGQSRRDEVRVQGGEAALSIVTVNKSGVPAPLDYEITVPVRASLDISGTYTDITIEGVRGSVSATTVQGGVSLRGGDGVISLKSVEGAVTAQDATGRIEVNGVNKGLVLRNVNGDIAAETVNGSIELDGIESSDVDAETVNGRVTYVGSIRDRGRYRFGSHNGTITISIPERSNATVAAMSYQGTFSSRFELPKMIADGSARVSGRANFALGTGSARIEAESFQGDIILARPGDPAIRPR